MRAITVRQPWAWAIIHGGKDIENRDWKPYQNYQGLLLIHAGLFTKTAKRQLVADIAWIRDFAKLQVPLDELYCGAIIGVVDLTYCHINNRRQQRGIWGQAGSLYHWELKNPRPLPQPIPCPGKHKLWTPNPEISRAVSDQLSLTLVR